MIPRAALDEELILRLGLGFTGIVLLAAAFLGGDMALQHMAMIGTICGASPHPHCGWCYGTAGLALPGLAAFAVPFRPRAGRLIQRKAS